MTLLDLLKDRYNQAEKYTKANFIDDINRSVEDYDAKDVSLAELIKSGTKGINQRYEFTIPLVFTNTEAMKASLWDRLPDLIFKGRGKEDEDKKRKVEASYQYLKDKLDLETFAFAASHWFILGGFVSTFASFKSETYDSPIFNDDGTPQIDESTGEPLTQTLYSYNDPVLELGDPTKVYFSSESEFSINADKVPFMFRSKLMTVEDIKKTYGVDVEPDTELSIKEFTSKKENKDDIKRAKVCFYTGCLPESVKDEVEDWESGADFMVIYTEKTILHSERQSEKLCKLAKWYGQPNSFFGFGFGKIGRQFQKEKSIRRGQQIRLADVAAYPKWAIKNDGSNKIDANKLVDPRENIVILYETDPPSILAPGDLSKVVTSAAQEADQDAQQAFGMLDISQGSQSSTVVKTATGQSIFADAADKRVKLAKNNFMKFYQAVVIMLLKLCQANWDEQKLVTITDENGQEQEVSINKEDLQGIDFDKDIEINPESASSNKDVIRQQYISLYDKVKDDPLIDRKSIFKDMVRYGFDIRSPDRYLNESNLQPGMTLVDQMGNQYVVDQSGEVVNAQDMNELGTPSGGDSTPSSVDALMGSVNDVGTSG